MNILELISENVGKLEIIGACVGLAYIYLEYRASVWLWLASIIMPAIYVFVYYEAGLYADVGINIYFLGASIYGLMVWTGLLKAGRGKGPEKTKKDLPISRTPSKLILPLTAAFLVSLGVVYWLLDNFTNSNVPFWNAVTTAGSFVAMWMLSRKYVEQWLVWLVVDIICVRLYIYKEIPYTAGLYGIYCVMAVLGYIKWIRMMKKARTGTEKSPSGDNNV